MRLGQHQEAFSRDLVKLALKAFELGYEIRWGEVQRMPEMQAIYVQTGRSKTMLSNHLKKCAADLHFFMEGKLCYPEELGRYWESLNPLNRAGMFWKSFKDGPHFERNC
jgi:peptidoglycan L-alanyl-D-glutamate endopeptidase CwlK